MYAGKLIKFSLTLCTASGPILNAVIIAMISCFALAGSSPAQHSQVAMCSKAKSPLTSYRPATSVQTDSSIDVTYYGLSLQIFTSPDLLRGSVTIVSVSMKDSLNSFFYNFSNTLTVDSVTSTGSHINFTHSLGRLTVTPDTMLKEGDVSEITVHYHGVPDATGFGSFVFDEINGRPSVWTLSEPYGAMDWFPCKNTPSDKADSSDMMIRCSGSMTPVSNGSLISVLVNGDGTHTYHWKNSYPIAQYLISLAVSDFTKFFFNHYYNATEYFPVENYLYPETFAGIDSLLLKTNDMLDIFSGLFGTYPFIKEKYGHAEFGRLGGMEHQTISSMGVFNEDIMAHELAHQWFGDKITCRDWQDIWLNEGFAVYSEALYNEFEYGKDAYNNFLRLRMANAKLAQGTVYVQDIKSIQEIFSGSRSYAKGCVILHMLRGVLGDSLFFSTIHTYAKDTSLAYGTAVTSDFRKVAEEVSGTDLGYFFDEWIYGEGYPKYNVSWEVLESSGGYTAKINVLQSVNTFPQYFTMPLEILVETVSGDTLIKVFNNSQSAVYEVALNSKPVSFSIDPRNLILKDVSGEGIIPVSFSLGQNFPNPFNPGTSIVYELARPADVRIEIYDILGRKVYSTFETGKRDGVYTIDIYLQGISSGIYFYTMTAYSPGFRDVLFTQTRRMAYIK